jgi:hypothetical protein
LLQDRAIDPISFGAKRLEMVERLDYERWSLR